MQIIAVTMQIVGITLVFISFLTSTDGSPITTRNRLSTRGLQLTVPKNEKMEIVQNGSLVLSRRVDQPQTATLMATNNNPENVTFILNDTTVGQFTNSKSFNESVVEQVNEFYHSIKQVLLDQTNKTDFISDQYLINDLIEFFNTTKLLAMAPEYSLVNATSMVSTDPDSEPLGLLYTTEGSGENASNDTYRTTSTVQYIETSTTTEAPSTTEVSSATPLQRSLTTAEASHSPEDLETSTVSATSTATSTTPAIATTVTFHLLALSNNHHSGNGSDETLLSTITTESPLNATAIRKLITNSEHITSAMSTLQMEKFTEEPSRMLNTNSVIITSTAHPLLVTGTPPMNNIMNMSKAKFIWSTAASANESTKANSDSDGSLLTTILKNDFLLETIVIISSAILLILILITCAMVILCYRRKRSYPSNAYLPRIHLHGTDVGATLSTSSNISLVSSRRRMGTASERCLQTYYALSMERSPNNSIPGSPKSHSTQSDATVLY